MNSRNAAPVEVEVTAAMNGQQTPRPLPEAVKEFERYYLLSMLKRYQWRKAKTAAALGILPRTLRRKIREYRIEPE
jgi:DNA-binding NtrC family response regulator